MFIRKLLKTGFTYSDLTTSVKGFLQDKKKKRDKQRQRAHVAQNDESSSSDTEPVSDIEQVEETEDIEEICEMQSTDVSGWELRVCLNSEPA